MLEIQFRGIAPIESVNVDMTFGTGTLVLVGSERIAKKAARLGRLVMGGALFEFLASAPEPDPRPIFLLLNLPAKTIRNSATKNLVRALRDFGATQWNVDLKKEVPLLGKLSWYAFASVPGGGYVPGRGCARRRQCRSGGASM
ncbi:hypothetical protein AMAG_15603 [Allomyces macrogynus ATCC 38327]|uniref:Uncharacterized protein n=1 Tax=Allomyces macrogynus (strain ATCC 38327) TaxID=578462 RepID=A0A0L0T9X8_ALLM3|nr:hypothetical protein AMAG_15603 [Allomyces macrogynus ATCC 38327]|eukprot:KNE71369.1 hypothetical protein AMAG_15603 [Allomyces macrogynus ATCC 38327]